MQTEPPALVAAATSGARIRLADGRELIDGIASWWTACHGYNHPHIFDAVQRQLATMPHVMFGGLTHDPVETLARRLAEMLPGAGTVAALQHVFFTDSGSVAVEVALKMAAQYWLNRGTRGRTRFVTFRHAYHGDTMGAMSVCDPVEGMHRMFGGWMPEQIFAGLPRDEATRTAFDQLIAANRDQVAAVIVEPLVQAAGGMKFHDADVLRFVQETCRRHDVLFIADEIATGFGRTGALFACDEAGVVPDIMCIGKALTGGTMSLGATAAGSRVFDAFLGHEAKKAFMHGPTFMANSLACAAANASLDLFADGERLKQVAAIEAHMTEALAPCRDLAGIKDVRVKGAIGAVQMSRPRDIDWLRMRLVEQGVWLRPFGDVAYMMPAFTVTGEELGALCGAMVKVMDEWSRNARDVA